MSEKLVGLGVRVPREVHEKAKTDAEFAGENLKDYVINLIETGPPKGSKDGESDLIKLLTAPRTSDKFGDETILEEMLRRLISLQLVASNSMVEDRGLEATNVVMDRLDPIAYKVRRNR